MGLRGRVGAVVVAGGLGLYYLVAFLGPSDGVLARIRVPATHPHFADTAVVTAGWECTRRGYDVLLIDPCDRFGRITNYPRVWMILRFLGLGQGQTQAIGVGLLVLFVVTAAGVCSRLTLPQAFASLLLLGASAPTFAVERGNSDLVVLALLVAAAVVVGRRPGSAGACALAAVLLLVAAFLKIYPAAALVLIPMVARGAARRTAVVVSATALLATVAYAVLTLNDLRLIRAGTPEAVSPAFGASLTPYLRHPPVVGFLWSPVTGAVVSLVVLLVVAAVARGTGPLWRAAPTPTTAALAVVGSASYLLAFAIGTSFSYRLVVLTPLLPLLLGLPRTPRLLVLAPVGVLLWAIQPDYVDAAVICGWLVFALCGAVLTWIGLDALRAYGRGVPTDIGPSQAAPYSGVTPIFTR